MASSADATDVVGPVGSKVPTAAAGAAPSNTTQFLQRRKRLQRRLEEQGVRLPTTAVVNIDLADIDEDQKLYEDVEKKCMLLPLDEKSGQPAERFNQHVLLKELDAYVKRIRDGKLWDLVLTYYCALVKRFSEVFIMSVEFVKRTHFGLIQRHFPFVCDSSRKTSSIKCAPSKCSVVTCNTRSKHQIPPAMRA